MPNNQISKPPEYELGVDPKLDAFFTGPEFTALQDKWMNPANDKKEILTELGRLMYDKGLRYTPSLGLTQTGEETGTPHYIYGEFQVELGEALEDNRLLAPKIHLTPKNADMVKVVALLLYIQNYFFINNPPDYLSFNFKVALPPNVYTSSGRIGNDYLHKYPPRIVIYPLKRMGQNTQIKYWTLDNDISSFFYFFLKVFDHYKFEEDRDYPTRFAESIFPGINSQDYNVNAFARLVASPPSERGSLDTSNAKQGHVLKGYYEARSKALGNRS